MRRFQKALVLMLVLTLIASLSIGCGQKAEEEPKQEEPQASEQPAAPEEPKKTPQIINLNLSTEPPNLDPAIATDTTSSWILEHVMEGLYYLDQESRPVPGMATGYEVSDDGLVYTFHLRDAKWSNGDPVTAYDFEFAWKRALDPETASEYAYQLYYIKNGEAFNSGEVTADEVGVKALDDKTLEVTLEAPAPYFISLTSFHTLFPVPKKVVEANPDWHANADTFVGNGPFLLKEWKHDEKVVLVQNPNYWNAGEAKLEQINFVMVNDENTEYQMYQVGDLDIARPPTDLTGQMIKEGKAKTTPFLAVYYYLFNVNDPVLKNKKIRKALAYSVDRQAIIDNILQGGQEAAYSFVPHGVPGEKGDFRDEGGNFFKYDPAKAKELLAEGMAELGLSELPTLTISFNTSEGHQKIAQAIQEMWKKNLGIDVDLFNQEWKVYLQTLHKKDYQIGRLGWVGDYIDPMTFIDMWVTDGGNNHSGWGNAKYDELVAKAKSTGDPAVRMPAMHQAEEILMEEMPIMPLYFYTRVYLQKDYVKGVVRHANSNPILRWAYIEGK